MAKGTTKEKRKSSSVGERARKSAKKNGEIAAGKGRRRRTGGNPISDVEMLYRLRIVEAALIDGKRGAEIIEALALEGRVVPYSTVCDYMRRVRDKWEQEDSLLRPLWRERQLRKLHDVAAKLEKGMNWGHWVNVQKLIAQVEGNLAPQKLEVEHHSDPFDGWTIEELRRFVESEGKEIPSRFGETGPELGVSGSDRNPNPGSNGSGKVTFH